MAMKTIIERQAKPWMRDELVRRMDPIIGTMRDVPGFVAATRYEVLDDPAGLIEIAEWESPEARQSWLDRVMALGELGPLLEVLNAPFRATNVRQID